MDFKTYFFGLTVAQREDFSARASTTRGMLTQVAYRHKEIELGFADVLVKLAGGLVSLDELPLTQNAARQRAIRDGGKAAVAPPRKGAHTTVVAGDLGAAKALPSA